MLPGMEMMACGELAVPQQVMAHVVNVESSSNPYAIGVVGGRLTRQPRSIEEAVATATMLEQKGYNFSVGLAQVNRHNLRKQGLASYEVAFQQCPNLQAGARILAECHSRSGGDWGKSFSCYYSGNFETGFRDGYVHKVFASINAQSLSASSAAAAIPVASAASATPVPAHQQVTRPEYFGRTVAASPQRDISEDQARIGHSIRRAQLQEAPEQAVAAPTKLVGVARQVQARPAAASGQLQPAGGLTEGNSHQPVVDSAFVF